jgi:hypothetical protein
VLLTKLGKYLYSKILILLKRYVFSIRVMPR